MRRFLGSRWGVFVIVVLILAGLGWVVYLAIPDHERWVGRCVNAGGHVRTETSTYETFKYAEGERVAQTHTVNVHFCLSDTGEIIDIRR